MSGTLIVRTVPFPGVLQVEFARPESRNALNEEMLSGLASAWDVLERSSELHVAVLVARGVSFCAGADIRSATPESISESLGEDLIARAFLQMDPPSKPVIAGINGHCVGGGLMLALGCDLRIGSPRATFAIPALKLGYHPRSAVPMLVSHVGNGVARSMILTGSTLGANEALGAGLLSEVVPEEQLNSRVHEIAQAMAGADIPTLTSLVSVLRATRLPCDAVQAVDGLAASESMRRHR